MGGNLLREEEEAPSDEDNSGGSPVPNPFSEGERVLIDHVVQLYEARVLHPFLPLPHPFPLSLSHLECLYTKTDPCCCCEE